MVTKHRWWKQIVVVIISLFFVVSVRIIAEGVSWQNSLVFMPVTKMPVTLNRVLSDESFETVTPSSSSSSSLSSSKKNTSTTLHKVVFKPSLKNHLSVKVPRIFKKPQPSTHKNDSRDWKSYPTLLMPFVVGGSNKVDIPLEDMEDAPLVSDIQPSTRNVTNPKANVLIYNRVPKCGSSTFNALLSNLCKKNHHLCRHSNVYNEHWLSPNKRRKEFKPLYDNWKNATVFERHLYYFNTTKFGFPRPVWVNLVREPLARFVSLFYYNRKRSRWRQLRFLKRVAPPPSWWFDMTINDCVMANRPECQPSSLDMNLQLTFFCGHHPECRKVGSRWALQFAKRHVEEEYSVVAILEEFSLSLKVLKQYVPKFFWNVETAPQSTGNVKLNRNVRHQERLVKSETREALKDVLREDIEFYEFLRQRLHLQAQALGLN